MASRLLLIASGITTGTRTLLFGDRTDLIDPGPDVRWPARMASLTSGPETACLSTARRSGRELEVEPRLASFDAGRWAGRCLDDVAAVDPVGVAAWLRDPTATPHGGESLAALILRVGDYCDEREWPQGRNVVVLTPLVARAIVVHALGAPAAVIFRVDLAPLGRVGLSRQGAGWRLQQLG